jgi:hypothetical protein
MGVSLQRRRQKLIPSRKIRTRLGDSFQSAIIVYRLEPHVNDNAPERKIAPGWGDGGL